MSESDQNRWNRKWAERARPARVSQLLRANEEILSSGRALDLACGQGQNSVWLAQHGYTTLGVDISRVALTTARAAAASQGVGGHTLFVQVDLDRWRPPVAAFDLIAVFKFLDRGLYGSLRAALRPGGLLFYETRHGGIRERIPDANPDYLLRPGELASVFGAWEQLLHDEGPENARLVARKPSA